MKEKHEVKYYGNEKELDRIFSFWHSSNFFDEEGKYKGPVMLGPSLELVTYWFIIRVGTRAFLTTDEPNENYVTVYDKSKGFLNKSETWGESGGEVVDLKGKTLQECYTFLVSKYVEYSMKQGYIK